MIEVCDKPVLKFNRKQQINKYITMLGNPNILPEDRKLWEDSLPLTDKDKVIFILEANAAYNLSLFPKL